MKLYIVKVLLDDIVLVTDDKQYAIEHAGYYRNGEVWEYTTNVTNSETLIYTPIEVKK